MEKAEKKKRIKLSDNPKLIEWFHANIRMLYLSGTSFYRAAQIASCDLCLHYAHSTYQRAISKIAEGFRIKHFDDSENTRPVYYAWGGASKDITQEEALSSDEWETMRLKLSHLRNMTDPEEVALLLRYDLGFSFGVPNVREMMRLMKFDIEEAA